MAITDQEYEVFGKFLVDHGLETDGPAGDTNGVLLAQVLNARNQRITEANLQAAFEILKTNPRLTRLDPTRAEFNRLASYFSKPEQDQIATFLSEQGFAVQPEDVLLRNWNIFARFLVENKATSGTTGKSYSGKALAVTPETLQFALRGLQRSPQFQQLQWKPRQVQQPTRKFDSEATAKAEGFELGEDGGYHRKQAPNQPDPSQLTVTHVAQDGSLVRPLPPHLKAHQDSVHRAMEAAEAAKHIEAPKSDDSYWKGRVQQFLAWIPENVIRMELEPHFTKPLNGNWEWTHRVLSNLYNRKKNDRSLNVEEFLRKTHE